MKLCEMPSLSKFNIQSNEIVAFLQKTIRLRETCEKIIAQKVIIQAAQAKNLIVTPEETQAEGDRFRREQRLEKTVDTLAWLADQMITVEDWEAGIRDRLMAQKLANSLFAKEVEKFFAQNQVDFEQVLLYQIIVPDERIAREVLYQVEEQEISFYEAAHLYDIDELRRYQCGYEGKLYRWNLKPDIATVVFGAQPGAVTEPVRTDQGYHLLLVEEFISAQLTPEIYQDILDKMFGEWIVSELNYMIHNQPE